MIAVAASLAVVALQVFACLGAGALALKALGLLDDLPRRERPLWAFTLGLGILGWIVFPLALAGLANAPAFLLTEGALALGCALFRPARSWLDPGRFAWPGPVRKEWAGWALGLAAVLVLALDLAEAFAPPLDADSLAYHFARPREILRAGRIEFIPLAVDNAGAFLVQMTYLPPLALGGERALTLWCLVSGWAAPVFLYVLARRWLDPLWAGTAALVLATTPAWIFGAGSGQVEPRLALFALAGLFAAAEARRSGCGRQALLAGLAAGFYAAGKVSGLFFVAAAGLVVAAGRDRFRAAIGFALGALVAGFQWYAWNAVSTGDPIFPGLYSILGARDPSLWNDAVDTAFRAMTLASERPATETAFWLFAYPFAASVGLGFATWDAGRTGFGPYGLLILPFVLGGLWRWRDRLRGSLLFGVALAVLLFYLFWIVAGLSQRIRHFLPLLPAFLLMATVVARRHAAAFGRTRILALAAGATLAVHGATLALFALPYVRYFASGEDRAAFLDARLSAYSAVPLVNALAGDGDRVLTTARQLNYYLAPDYVYTLPFLRAVPDLLSDTRNIRKQWEQIRSLSVTHLLVITGLSDPTPNSHLWRLGHALVDAGCADIAGSTAISIIGSRTLAGQVSAPASADVLRLRPDRCVPERLPRN